ncbi:kinesin-like protein KIF23 [Caerostris darwini]|uniref:Kinesin-like protein n=1 Tax=Caerostris darwini TaxID=1538125 RepID=A0AAV4RF97_9ARAC|nr:kinesin-like protein KIF23 [Caerostris darwini]
MPSLTYATKLVCQLSRLFENNFPAEFDFIEKLGRMNAKQICVKDAIEVYCRIRPLDSANDATCLRANDKNTVILFPPDMLHSTKILKEVHYSFKKVFDSEASQKQLFNQVSLPLVEDTLLGCNGLIFTYGITSSGKTYTMAGTPQDGGLLPRSLDVIFNSIKDCQAPKFVFKPDKLNAFDTQLTSDAMLDCQMEMRLHNKASMKNSRREKILTERIPDETVITELPPDVHFSVFVSYVEIYNNYIYDLLEELPSDTKRKMNFNSKMLREDASRNMYVFGVIETEVKTVEEALDLFYKGQLRKRVSNTALNTESSRSHSIFTIRVVHAPLDPLGAEVLLDKDLISVGQLSLVDLAGSERCTRTKSAGQKLREAGNINASLMALRNCIEILRESQISGINKKIPYRDSKLTHLFKSYFEGKGKVRMIVCVNPQAAYFDETLHVMKFAELAQDVTISRTIPTALKLGLTPGRGKLYRDAVKKSKQEKIPVTDILSPTIYTLGPPFPFLDLDIFDEAYYMNLIEFLENRQNRRGILINDLNHKNDEFRKNLVALDSDNFKLKEEKAALKQDLDYKIRKIQHLEDKLVMVEQNNEVLEKQLSISREELENLKTQLESADKILFNQRNEVGEYKIKMKEKIAFEKDRMRRLMEKRLAEKQAELEYKMCLTDEKFRELKEILNSEDWDLIGDMPIQPISDCNPQLQPALPSILKLTKSRSSLEIPLEPRMLKSRSASNFMGKTLRSIYT